MAILNYADQFKYTGKGYVDSKLEPKKNLSELNSMNALQLAKFYTPGMKVVVLDDGLGHGPSEYILTKEYKWERFDKNFEIEGIKEETKSLSERLNEISVKANKNTENIENLSEKLLNIAGLEKLKAGDNVSLISQEDGSVVLSVDLSKVPVVDTTEIENRLDVIEERLESITGGGSDVTVDNETIIKNENKTLSVKISQKEGNALVREEDGLFSQGIFITGDDNEEIE